MITFSGHETSVLRNKRNMSEAKQRFRCVRSCHMPNTNQRYVAQATTHLADDSTGRDRRFSKEPDLNVARAGIENAWVSRISDQTYFGVFANGMALVVEN